MKRLCLGMNDRADQSPPLFLFGGGLSCLWTGDCLTVTNKLPRELRKVAIIKEIKTKLMHREWVEKIQACQNKI